jgi:2-oxoglutarate ferredoxin oxidoreductase subunit beta
VQCPTNYGRRNRFKQVADQIEYFKSHTILVEKAARMREKGEMIPPEMILAGEFVRRNRPALGVRP